MATPLQTETGASFTIPGTPVTIVWTGEPISTVLLTAVFTILNVIGFDPFFGLFDETRISQEKDQIGDLLQPMFEMLHAQGWSNDRGGDFDQFSDAEGTLQQDPHIWEQASRALQYDGPGICVALYDDGCPEGYDERFVYQWWVNAWGDGWSDAQRIAAWNAMLIGMGVTPRAWPVTGGGQIPLPTPEHPRIGGVLIIPPVVPYIPATDITPPPPYITALPTLTQEQVAYIQATSGYGQEYLDYLAGLPPQPPVYKAPVHIASQGWEWYYYPADAYRSAEHFSAGNIVYFGFDLVYPSQLLPGMFAPHLGGPPQVIEIPVVPLTPRVQPTDCPIGTHWSPRLGICVRNRQDEPPDDPHDCPLGSHWDQELQGCVPDFVPPQCPVGSHWDPNLEQCVQDDPPPPDPQPDPGDCNPDCLQAIAYTRQYFVDLFNQSNWYRDHVLHPEIKQAQDCCRQQQVVEIPRLQQQIDHLGHQQNLDRAFDEQWNEDQDARLRDLDQESKYRDQLIIDTLAPQIGQVAQRSQDCCRQQQQDINYFWQFFNYTWPVTLSEIYNAITQNIANFYNTTIVNQLNQLTTYVTNLVTTQVNNLNTYITNEVKRGVEALYIRWCDIAKVHLGMMMECWFEDNTNPPRPIGRAFAEMQDLQVVADMFHDLVEEQPKDKWAQTAQFGAAMWEQVAVEGKFFPSEGLFAPLPIAKFLYDRPDECERQNAFTGIRTPSLVQGERDPVKKPEKC